MFAFSGVGGFVEPDGPVRYHLVRQLPIVVGVDAPKGRAAVDLLLSTKLPIGREVDMESWLATHSIFIAGVGSLLLANGNGEPNDPQLVESASA